MGFCVARTQNNPSSGYVVSARHLPFLHRLEKRARHLGRRAVDLIGEKNLGEDGPELGCERPLGRIEDQRSGQVGRQKIGRELNPVKRRLDRLRHRLDGEGLREARHPFQEEVSVRQ